MIEAYEIGISLALSDGVSESIAAARRDMAAIDAAVRSNQVSLIQLRHAASGMRSPAAEMPVRAARLTATGPAVAEPPVGAPVVAGAGAAVPKVELAGIQATPSAAADFGTPVVAAPVSRVAAAPEGFTAPRPVRRFEANPVRADAKASDGEGSSVMATAAPVASNLPAWSHSVIHAAPVGIVSNPSREVAAPAVAPVALGQTLARDDSMGAASAYAPSPAPAGGGFGSRVLPGGPSIEAARTGGSRSARDVGQRATAAPSMPSDGGEAVAAPTGGDVYLDGALVGRWLARHLAREAGRAGAGPTGFDPRRSALLPGATVAT